MKTWNRRFNESENLYKWEEKNIYIYVCGFFYRIKSSSFLLDTILSFLLNKLKFTHGYRTKICVVVLLYKSLDRKTKY